MERDITFFVLDVYFYITTAGFLFFQNELINFIGIYFTGC